MKLSKHFKISLYQISPVLLVIGCVWLCIAVILALADYVLNATPLFLHAMLDAAIGGAHLWLAKRAKCWKYLVENKNV